MACPRTVWALACGMTCAWLASGCGSSGGSQAAPPQDAGADAIGLDATSDRNVTADGPTSDGACGADVHTDPHNCGACGHDCLGGTCVSGFCQPVDIPVGIEGTEQVHCFTLDQGTLYYAFTDNTGANHIDAVPVDGGTTTTLAGESGCPVLVAGGSVYWLATPQQVRTVPIAGGTPSTAITLNGTPPNGDSIYTERFSSDGTSLFWVENKNAPTDAGTSLQTMAVSVPLTGGTPTTLGNLAFSGTPCQQQPTGDCSVTAVASGFVYAFDGLGPKKVPVGGGTPVLLSGEGGYFPVALAVNGEGVFWLRSDIGIYGVPLGGGVSKQIAGAQTGQDMVIDSTTAYYCDYEGLKTAPLDGGGPQSLRVSKSVPCGLSAGRLAVDATAVYYSSGDAIIHRLAK